MRINQVTFFLTILAVLILCLLPETDILAHRKTRVTGIVKLKSLGVAFDKYDDTSAHSKSSEEGTVESSNKIFRQLFKAGAIYDEQLFTLGTKSYPSSMADNIVSPSSEILRAGECHHTFVSRSEPSGPDEGAASVPVVITFLNPNSKKFDQEIYRGEVVYLNSDSSVGSAKLNEDGNPLAKGSKSLPLFQNGPGTLWGDRTPTLHPPLPFSAQGEKGLFQHDGLVLFLKISCVIFLFFLVFRLLVVVWKRTIRMITSS